jgi:hypothetical protein
MKQKKVLIIGLLIAVIVIYFGCNSDSRIEKLLSSENLNDNINGAIKAGDKGNKKFIPLLLKNAADWSMSTHISFYGVSVYQAKMRALEKIFKISPPTEITYKPDSAIIKFYTELYNKESK